MTTDGFACFEWDVKTAPTPVLHGASADGVAKRDYEYKFSFLSFW